MFHGGEARDEDDGRVGVQGLQVTNQSLIYRLDGEARSREWSQIKADVLGESITPSLRVEAPAIGAAILAGIGSGAFATVEDGLAVVLELAPAVHPDPDAHLEYTALLRSWEAVRGTVFPSLAPVH